MMPSQNYAIEVKGLRKDFGDVVAVDGIDFSVADGSITALLGGNGAGKTTTMAMLLGLMLPTSGSITVLGRDMLRDRFSVLPYMNFSSPYVDMPNRLTVRQNLIVYGNYYGVKNLGIRIAELGELLQIAELLNRKHSFLSAGQRTRAMLAKALLNSPRVLLLDEPTASLDPDTADWVRALFMNYQKKTGATLFLASHNMAEVERMCDDVIMLKEGKIVDRGSPAHLLRTYGRGTLEEVFLDIARERHASSI
jgi:ABC-2 type transport system ATP-binding protein